MFVNENWAHVSLFEKLNPLENNNWPVCIFETTGFTSYMYSKKNVYCVVGIALHLSVQLVIRDDIYFSFIRCHLFAHSVRRYLT